MLNKNLPTLSVLLAATAWLASCASIDLLPKIIAPPAAKEQTKPKPAKKMATVPTTPTGIETVLAHPIVAKDKDRFFDCVENSAATRPLHFPIPEFQLFAAEPNPKRRFYLTEENGWPFVIGYHATERAMPVGTWVVAMRGEGSAFHKSALSSPLVSLMDSLPGAALITVDEYIYNGKNGAQKRLNPICHRSVYGARYIGPETPGFESGGATRILKKILPMKNPVVFVSYSNATSPRGEFVARKLRGKEKIDYRAFRDPKEFLTAYILKTSFNESVYAGIKGFVDIEGNFEYTKSFWDLMAFVKLEIERNPKKFFYSAVRVEKPDAFPVQTTMIRLFGLKGVEGNDGVIRYKNSAGNIVIDVLTNPYQPHYAGVGGDLRYTTHFTPAAAKTVRRAYVSHIGMPAWTLKRIVSTTKFFDKEMQRYPQKAMLIP